ncbi:MAG: penicillin-binding protein A, partial [Clostridia bacterium]|nr:penicillin-binding protein A [Clostridia bacterium]
QSAIGQAGNLVSPVQLCNYCATIANGGTRYSVHLVKSVLKYDNSRVVIEKTPEIVNKVGLSQKTLDLVREGMHRLCKIGYCRKYFSHLKRSIDPSGKTGTSQEYRKINGKSTKINNGFFISFAPYDEPKIAVAVVGEGMTSGTYVAPVAAAIYEYYFSEGEEPVEAQAENSLLG